jgi:ATP-dependent RNA helicase DDX31/DBP7
VPTRELCMQMYEIAQKLVHPFHWIVPGYIMGGDNRTKVKSSLHKGILFVIRWFSYVSVLWILYILFQSSS